MQLYGIVGAGGFGREVKPIAEQMLQSRQADFKLVFIEKEDGDAIDGCHVMSEGTFLRHPGERFFNIAISDSVLRERIANRLIDSGALSFSITDGTNDAQKIMGIATMLLVYYGFLSEFYVPLWVMLLSYSTLSMGTFLGGWRVVKTMATKITKIRPYQGFAAEVGSSMILGTAALTGLPVSSTHAAGGSIMGVGLAHRRKAVKWRTSREIVVAWVLSMPLSAVFAYLTYYLVSLIF